jgi:hypothetical protein
MPPCAPHEIGLRPRLLPHCERRMWAYSSRAQLHTGHSKSVDKNEARMTGWAEFVRVARPSGSGVMQPFERHVSPIFDRRVVAGRCPRNRPYSPSLPLDLSANRNSSSGLPKSHWLPRTWRSSMCRYSQTLIGRNLRPHPLTAEATHERFSCVVVRTARCVEVRRSRCPEARPQTLLASLLTLTLT